MPFYSESEKVHTLPNVMKYITGRILDIGCADHKILPQAIGVDGRPLAGVDIVTSDLGTLWDTQQYGSECQTYDTVFSSHLLEHVEEPFWMLHCWKHCMKKGGHLVLYLPEKSHYDNYQNPEHLWNWSYEDFLFSFKRQMCGEGKNFEGEHLEPAFKLIECGEHYGPDLYSFYIVAEKL